MNLTRGNVYGLIVLSDDSVIVGQDSGFNGDSRLDAEGNILWQHPSFSYDFAWDLNGGRLYTCSSNGIRLRDLEEGHILHNNFGSFGGRCWSLYVD